MHYSVIFTREAEESFLGLDKAVRIRIAKKILQLEREGFASRHLKFGLPFFVEEIGGYRLVFETLEAEKKKIVIFVGSHHDYQKWYSGGRKTN
ncbi:MAG: hypothetical protein V1909_03235 [Candidatus Micrarchaeota archaeon]